MSGFKGTPGPWDIEFNNKATKAKVSGEGWEEFARVWIEPSKVEGMANARLIAAAPDLLEAIEICLKAEYARREKLLPGAPATTYTQARIDKIEAAIAKALGEE